MQNINPLTISNQHMNQLVDLVMTTDHFQYYSQMHTLSSDHEFSKTDFIMPYIHHIKMILDEFNNVAGFSAALIKKCDSKIVKDMHWNRTDPNVQLLFNAENILLDYIADDDYFLHVFAIRSDLHGVAHQKYQKKMSCLLLEELLDDGYETKSQSLAIITWESHTAAVKLYKRFGGEIIKSVDLHDSIFTDTLLLMKIPIASRDLL